MFIDNLVTPWAFLLVPVFFFVAPFLRNWSIRDVPAPFPAAWSNLWLMYHSRKGQRSFAVDAAHKKYGKFVRIQPNHVSIADEAAIQAVYGHGNGFIKSEYYDVYVSIVRGLFNTRDRAEHARKRKLISHTFSAKSVAQFEQYMHANLEMFAKQWDKLSAEAPKGGYTKMDALNWYNYLAFDVIGDLAFGEPFGMLERGEDVAVLQMTLDGPPTRAPAIEVINRRGEVSNTLGCIPQLKPYAAYIPDPFFTKGAKAVEQLAGIAIARVNKRLQNAEKVDRKDVLARLMEGRDDKGQPLGRKELVAEALTQLVAGSDTTSNTSCALLFYVLKNPHALKKLQRELDAALPTNDVPTFEQVKDLP